MRIRTIMLLAKRDFSPDQRLIYDQNHSQLDVRRYMHHPDIGESEKHQSDASLGPLHISGDRHRRLWSVSGMNGGSVKPEESRRSDRVLL
jgi:hypothetical protein